MTTPYRETPRYPDARAQLWASLVAAEKALAQRFMIIAAVAFRSNEGNLLWTTAPNGTWGLTVQTTKGSYRLLDYPVFCDQAAEALPALIAALLAAEKNYVHTLIDLNEKVRDAIATLKVVDGRS